MYSEKEIIDFIADKVGANPEEIDLNTDIFIELPCTGDDFHELIEAYAEKYSVDMKNYLWYFHADEEGTSFGGVVFSPPYQRVKRIPVTPHVVIIC